MAVASVTDALTPPWLVAWRERGQGGSGETAPVSAVAEAARPLRPKANVQGFVEPVPWPDDGGRRREQVLDVDHNPPRVVRVVGWQRCMTCRKPFWSDDTRHVRMCRDCKGTELYRRKPLRLSEDGTA